MNLASIWEAVADRVPDKTALVHGEQRVTFREFDRRAARLAAAFAAAGTGRDTKVAMYLFNCNEYLETAFAAMKLRAVPVNVNYRYLEEELHYLIENSDAEVLVYHGALAERVARVRARLPRLRLLVQVRTEEADRVSLLDGAVAYEDLIGSNDPAPRIARSGDDLLFLYTGGTTGLPKGVMWPHRALFAQFSAGYMPLGGFVPSTPQECADAAVQLDEMGAAGPSLAAAPLMHGMAWFTSMSTLMTGSTVVSLTSRSFDAHEFWRAVEENRVRMTTIVGDAFARPLVNALLEAEEKGKPYDLSSLFAVVVGRHHVDAAVQATLPRPRRRHGHRRARIERSHRRRHDDLDRRTGSEHGALPALAAHQGSDRGRARGGARLGRDRRARRRRRGATERLLQGRRQDEDDVPHRRRHPLRDPGRLRDGRGRRQHHASRARLGLHQHRRREGVPGGGRGGAQAASGGGRLHRGGRARRALGTSHRRGRRPGGRARTCPPTR